MAYDGGVSTPEPLTPWGPLVVEEPPPGTASRILDAAMERFTRQGIASTTMSQLAEDAGISRVWLYRFFAGRDAVVSALLGREAKRFLDQLAAATDLTLPITEAVESAFEFAIVTLRGHELLQRVLVHEPEVAAPFLSNGMGPVLRAAGDVIGPFLQLRAAMTPPAASAVADTLLRLVLSIMLNNETRVDFDDPAERLAYIKQVIPRLITP
jgi:AcrR family transcriptional regulator